MQMAGKKTVFSNKCTLSLSTLVYVQDNFCHSGSKYRRRNMKRFKNGSALHCVYDVCMNRKLVCMRNNVIKKRNVVCICALCMWKAAEVKKKPCDKARTFILYCLLLTSLVSVPFIKRTLLHCCTPAHTDKLYSYKDWDPGVSYDGKRQRWRDLTRSFSPLSRLPVRRAASTAVPLEPPLA